MRLRVEGRFRVVTLATGLPLLKVVTVTLETCGFFAVALRALGLRVETFLAVGAVAVGIREKRVDSFIIQSKGLTNYSIVTLWNKKVQFVNRPHHSLMGLQMWPQRNRWNLRTSWSSRGIRSTILETRCTVTWWIKKQLDFFKKRRCLLASLLKSSVDLGVYLILSPVE